MRRDQLKKFGFGLTLMPHPVKHLVLRRKVKLI